MPDAVSIVPYTLTHLVTKAYCDLSIIVILTRELSNLSRIMSKLLILTLDSSKTRAILKTQLDPYNITEGHPLHQEAVWLKK